MTMFATWLLAAVVTGSVPSSQEILSRVSNACAASHAMDYSGARQYTLRNLRFGKEATVSVRMTSRPGEGKHFTVVERSGTQKLVDIIEKIVESEALSSRPSHRALHEIGTANYEARLRGAETIAGRHCYVLELTPKSKSKYLIAGSLWVDRSNYGIVRLDGTLASNVSIWVGTPHVNLEFELVSGLWLPMHTKSVSTSTLLGESRLEIHYTDYQVTPR